MDALWLWWLVPVAIGGAMINALFGPPAPHRHSHHPAASCDDLPCDDHDLFA